MADPVPYWLLIAVLQSSIPLPEPLAMRLYHAALDLHLGGEGRAKLTGELAEGEVRRLGKDLLLGAIGGPGFEADIDTPTGSGHVRFLLTRQALELAEAARDRAGATDDAEAPEDRSPAAALAAATRAARKLRSPALPN